MNFDEMYMRRCIELAQLGVGQVAPNPMVGALVVHENRILGEGYHQKYGEAHAEVHAIQNVKEIDLLPESTIYVSLEPCTHQGKTPPCVDLILEKKIRRIVIGCQDSFEKVAGRSIQKLQMAGVDVTLGVLEKECRKLNKRFFNFHEKHRPYVILKWAQTQDGFIDKIRNIEDKVQINWVSSPETQSLVHHWRSQEQAILVGRKTIENDNPSLTVREVQGRNPIRIVLDSQLKITPESTIFKDGEKTVVFNRVKHEVQDNITYYKLESIDVKYILEALYHLNIQSVFVEGGSRTLQHFLVNNAWDEARIIVGSSIFQEGIKAPVIQGIPRFSKQFSSDMIHYYFRS